MKKISLPLFFLVLIFISGNCLGQGMWTWVNGDTTLTTANYGSIGIMNISNHPLPMYEALSWTDEIGNFWYYGDGDNLWKYDPLFNQWTWINGHGNPYPFYVDPTYGNIGVGSPLNNPGSREVCAATWADSSGNLWLFGGGTSSGVGADLWRYSISLNEWTWVSGSSSLPNDNGIYGIKGIPSINNYPSNRHESNASWFDETTNSLWLFGGQKQDGSQLNDLWKYNISSNEWTWMKGDSIPNAPPVYGTIKIQDSSNNPGGRNVYCKWKDLDGNFWMFGGGSLSAHYSDVWKYNISTNMWNWMNGPNYLGELGNSVGNCGFDTLNIPKCDFENKICWTDKCGMFWTLSSQPALLWKFDPTICQWMLLKGSNNQTIPGKFGSMNSLELSNWPFYGIGGNGWIDNFGHLYHYANGKCVMWKYFPDEDCGGCNLYPDNISQNISSPFYNIEIFPNPANESVTIKFNDATIVSEINLSNTIGQILFSKTSTTNSEVINLKSYPPGIYFITFQTQNNFLTKKLVITHH